MSLTMLPQQPGEDHGDGAGVAKTYFHGMSSNRRVRFDLPLHIAQSRDRHGTSPAERSVRVIGGKLC
jgi:hypothetical protein